jgi:hypothetical protein
MQRYMKSTTPGSGRSATSPSTCAPPARHADRMAPLSIREALKHLG